MPVTLAEAKKNVQDDLQMGVIDEFQKNNSYGRRRDADIRIHQTAHTAYSSVQSNQF